MKFSIPTPANIIIRNGVRNEDSLIKGIDFSFVGNVDGLTYPKVVTLVGPRHVLCAKHYNLSNGDTISFVNRVGVKVLSKTVREVGSRDDIVIWELDTDMTSQNVSVVKMAVFNDSVFAEFFRFLGLYRQKVISVGIDANAKTIVAGTNVVNGFMNSTSTKLAVFRQVATCIVENGDSGAPDFLVSNNELFLIGGHYSIVPRNYYTPIAYDFVKSLNVG